MPKNGTRKRNPPQRKTAQEREDTKDLAYMKRESKKPNYSWNNFMRELGFYDLVTPNKRSR